MIHVSEENARRVVGLRTAMDAVRKSFVDLHEGRCRLLPVVREGLSNRLGTFGVKSAEYDSLGLVGLKAGGYWPGNTGNNARLTNHQSTTLLIDATSGLALASVEANWLTEARTAAAGAVAMDVLARKDANTLGIFGTGMQARSQIEAALLARQFTTIRICGRNPATTTALVAATRQAHPGIEVVVTGAEDTVRASDVLITVTPSKEALFAPEWVPDGQHINAMGADTVGKRELPRALLGRARLFHDDLGQSEFLGEFQGYEDHADKSVSIGSVLANASAFSRSETDVTIFDGTGVAVQDIAVSWVAYKAA
ncbi:ornithine cyclodeaminase family protein [Aurantimonas sp. DM33-3]|uniref:ornithine cyclodeaminase family protein n=1 Tax=Aurantimonas sp. DM33-3 TaxID=2766955 RepID=UPI001651C8CE|nr:ornithine cyclodeaminase family protein [Aurantimonas sp. DM33-3]MBC6718603.1 ornithine cyclodeaminase family protein [Aurantimonas sp. DM33-3]